VDRVSYTQAQAIDTDEEKARNVQGQPHSENLTLSVGKADRDILSKMSNSPAAQYSNKGALVEVETVTSHPHLTERSIIYQSEDEEYNILMNPKAILRVIPGVLSVKELQEMVDRDIAFYFYMRKWGLLGYTIVTVATLIIALIFAGSHSPPVEQTLCILSFFFFVATFWTLFSKSFHRRLHPVLWSNPQLSLTVWSSDGMQIGNVGFSITFALCIAAQALTEFSRGVVLVVLWFLLSMAMAFFIYFPYTMATVHTVSVAILALILLIILIIEVACNSTDAVRWFQIALSFNIVGIIVMVGEQLLVSLQGIRGLNPLIYNNQLYYLFSILAYFIGLISRSFER